MAINGLSDSTPVECPRCSGEGEILTMSTDWNPWRREVESLATECTECNGTGEVDFAQAARYEEWQADRAFHYGA